MISTAIAAIAAILASSAFIWTASIILIIAMAITLEYEREGWATTFFSLGIALFLWNFRGQIWEMVSANPTATIGFAVSYVLVGIVWSFVKWRTYVMAVFNKFKEYREEFVRKNGVITSENLKNFNKKIDGKFSDPDGYGGTVSFYESSLEEMVKKIAPLASKKKSVITAWISYWPVSIAATLLNNPFRQFFEWIYSNLSGYYDKITNRYQKDALGI
jgi:hypothetical protein